MENSSIPSDLEAGDGVDLRRPISRCWGTSVESKRGGTKGRDGKKKKGVKDPKIDIYKGYNGDIGKWLGVVSVVKFVVLGRKNVGVNNCF